LPVDEPLVSIITPSYNQAEYLEAALLSVLRQDYPHIEYIVFDGGSKDGSLDILQRYQDRLTYWASEPDHGQADAINKGMRLATGEVVAWLNSDDMYVAGAVREAVEALQAHPQAGMVYGDGLMIDGYGRLLDEHRYRQNDLMDLLCWEVLLQPATFMRREALVKAGYLTEDYHLILDHELWIRIAARYEIVHVPSFWAFERTHLAAKTIAQAADWVEEAERFLARAAADPTLGSVIEDQKRLISASLDAFAARRYIDAARYRKAVDRFGRAFFRSPGVVLRYWYKVIQALFSMLGLPRLFFLYRRVRRRLQYRGRRVVMTEHGPELGYASPNKSKHG
jgi:glycosyltransferase involved in cell wall biosynthesis